MKVQAQDFLRGCRLHTIIKIQRREEREPRHILVYSSSESKTGSEEAEVMLEKEEGPFRSQECQRLYCLFTDQEELHVEQNWFPQILPETL